MLIALFQQFIHSDPSMGLASVFEILGSLLGSLARLTELVLRGVLALPRVRLGVRALGDNLDTALGERAAVILGQNENSTTMESTSLA